MRYAILALSAVAVSACGPRPQEETPVQSAAAVMLEIRPGTPLDSLLLRLDEHLFAALSGRLEGDAVIEFRRAEAITDRLLEASLPFEWIPDEHYRLESRLRQVQSAADRVLAMLETGSPRDTTLVELQALRRDVVDLRNTVARGGTRAPQPLDRLLRGADTAAAGIRRAQQQAPRPPAGPRPLGSPVPDTVPPQ
jgi:hypothetical protein